LKLPFIEKEAKSGNYHLSKRTYTASARAALQHILQAKYSICKKGVLLPSYIGLSQIEGSGILDPIKASGMPFEFYKVDHRLKPDLDALEQLLKTGSYQVVLLVHYFGAAQVEVFNFVKRCKDFGVQVIEDCAHSLTGGLEAPLLGTLGDYSIFSVHKSTASTSGGFFLDFVGDLSNQPLLKEMIMDRSSLECLANTDVNAISKIRVQNYHEIAKVVSKFQAVELFWPNGIKNAVPLNVPVILPEGSRAALYQALISRGISPTALYHTLVPEIGTNEFPEATFVSKNILNLPVHQDIPKSLLPWYLTNLGEALHEVYS
jgi:dTDP-4-amino-4,6-dideoxygalactose transaminase